MKIFIALGNLLEHYDHALFGLLAPFLAPLFFDPSDPLTALILTYGMLPLGFISKPIGALVFGWMGDRFGRKQSLCYSLLGMALVTAGIGFLPTYQDIGIWAPLFLAIARMLQSFFAAGETPGGAIFVLEQTASSNRGFVSSLFEASTIGGILIASGCIAALSYYDCIQQGWRFLFLGGSIAAIWGLIIRLKSQESREFLNAPRMNVKQLIRENAFPFMAIVAASGFSHITYHLSFTLMNGYAPLVASVAKTEVMQINTALLFLDMLILPCFGLLANRFGKEKIMLIGSFCSVATAIPLFSLLDHSSIGSVILVRVLIVLFGVAFAAPFHAWAIERIAPRGRYTLLALGNAIASQFIGAPTSALCLLLYQKTHWCASPGLYLLGFGLLATTVVYMNKPHFLGVTFPKGASNNNF